MKTQTIGLCAQCVHARVVESGKGSMFVMCEYSAIDAAYPKYPRLPVVSCKAFTEKEQSEEKA